MVLGWDFDRDEGVLMGKVLSDKSWDELRRSLAGTVIVPADAAYDAARRGFNARRDRRPRQLGKFTPSCFLLIV